MLTRYTLSITGSVLNVFLFRTAILANVSSAFIISLLSATSIVTSILFYFVFGEKLQRKHVAGIVLMAISVGFIANSQEDQELTLTEKAEPSISIAFPVAIALILSTIYAVNSMITRFARYRNIPSLQYSADTMLITSSLIISLFLYEQFVSGDPYTLQEAIPVILSSVFMLVGTLCLNVAMAFGKGGPAQAFIQL